MRCFQGRGALLLLLLFVFTCSVRSVLQPLCYAFCLLLAFFLSACLSPCTSLRSLARMSCCSRYYPLFTNAACVPVISLMHYCVCIRPCSSTVRSYSASRRTPMRLALMLPDLFIVPTLPSACPVSLLMLIFCRIRPCSWPAACCAPRRRPQRSSATGTHLTARCESKRMSPLAHTKSYGWPAQQLQPRRRPHCTPAAGTHPTGSC